MKAKATIRGIQELQEYNVRAIANLQFDGAVGEAIQYGVAALHRHAVVYTHVITGSLRGAHRMDVDRRGMRGTVSIDPRVVNPRTKKRPSIYGVEEHERGGTHAFYEVAVEKHGDSILEKMDDIIEGGLS